jgi:hypothetical protein
MNKTNVKRGVLGGLLILAIADGVGAISISLNAANQGITALDFTVLGNTIDIIETWGAAGPGVLQFDNVPPTENFTVTKRLTNNTGVDWNRFANELLDPAGDSNDTDLDPSPQPAFVPTGFSTSNDFDGLSFAQDSGIPRTSAAFASIFVDELSDARDFIDFFDGSVPGSGGTDTVSFGLRDNNANGDNQPFLLIERPNASSRAVPEPGTFSLLALSVVGLLLYYRRLRNQAPLK